MASWTEVSLKGYNLGFNNGSTDGLSVENVARETDCPMWLLKFHRTLFFSFLAQQPNFGIRRLIIEVPRSHTIRLSHSHTHTYGRTPLTEWSAHRRVRCLHNPQKTQETNIHALGGIGARDPGNRAATDLRFRPHGHQDQPSDFIPVLNKSSTIGWYLKGTSKRQFGKVVHSLYNYMFRQQWNAECELKIGIWDT